MTNTRSGMTHAAIEEMINQRVNAALEAHRVNQNLELGNGNDNGNGNGNGNGNDNGNGNGNGNNGGDNGDGNENHNVNGRGDRLVARECTYQDFMKCQPLSFKGTEGVVGLIRWSEKMETVFHISNCPEKYQVKYATCTLLDSALTWWNSHKRTIGTDAAYALSWRELMKLMTEVYCPRNEIQKMETELWNLSVKNNDIANYTQRFQELTMMCTKMVPEEEDRVEKFIGGLPDNIQGNVIAAEPTRLQDAVRIANNLMDQKLKGYAVRNAENKRRLDNNYGNNRGQQPPHKRQNTGGQNVARAYVAGNNEERQYEGHYQEGLPQDLKIQKRGNNKQSVPNARVELCYLRYHRAVDWDKGDKDKKSKWSILSCEKARSIFLENGCSLFLAQDFTSKVFSRRYYWTTSTTDKSNSNIDLVQVAAPIAKPMTKLTQKSVKFNWGEKEETAFQTLKRTVMSSVDAEEKGHSLCFPPLKSYEKNYTGHMIGIRSCGSSPLKMWMDYLYGIVKARKEENYGTEANILKESGVEKWSAYFVSISDSDGSTCPFWQSLQEAFRTQLDMSRHSPKTDCQSGGDYLYTLEDMLRACVIDSKRMGQTSTLIEFSYNKSYLQVLRPAPFEALSWSIGIQEEVPSIPGNAKTKCRRSTLICSLTLHLRPELRLEDKALLTGKGCHTL
ncbi:reverse transcriptase domain-containing protein [Tanacetum coccineum]